MRSSIILSLLALISLNGLQAKIVYRYQKQDLIPWEQIDLHTWFDYGVWKKRHLLKMKMPHWQRILVDRSLLRDVGRVLACSGRCLRHRGSQYSPVSRLSKIRQGDQLTTSVDSYLWLFLFDGTLVRLSPSSSFTMKEIAMSAKAILIHGVINWGNVLWLSRAPQTYTPTALRDTDTLFLPLKNVPENFSSNLEKYKHLNKLIEENNRFIKDRPTYTLLIAPNGTLVGKNLYVELIVLPGGPSFFKSRTYQRIAPEKRQERELEFYGRGFANKMSFYPHHNTWYTIDPDGNGMSKYSKAQKFLSGEFITNNIPSILTSREKWVKKYSRFLFSPLDRKVLAERFGYARRDSIHPRLDFLKEYTRRMRTSMLLASKAYRRRLQKRGATLSVDKYGNRFYSKALYDYFLGKNFDTKKIKVK